jgi:hypothetical protein
LQHYPVSQVTVFWFLFCSFFVLTRVIAYSDVGAAEARHAELDASSRRHLAAICHVFHAGDFDRHHLAAAGQLGKSKLQSSFFLRSNLFYFLFFQVIPDVNGMLFYAVSFFIFMSISVLPAVTNCTCCGFLF